MRRHDVALVIADSGEHGLGIEDLTADHIYVRMHGQGDELSETGYPDAALHRLAERIEIWSAGKQPDDAVCVSDGHPAGEPTRHATPCASSRSSLLERWAKHPASR